jgi:hypothetical protein
MIFSRNSNLCYSSTSIDVHEMVYCDTFHHLTKLLIEAPLKNYEVQNSL